MFFEIAALFVCILFWRSLKYSRLRWFLPFLLFIVLAELTGRYLSKELKQPNAWLYNFVLPVEYSFYAIIFLLHFRKRIDRLIVIGFLILFGAYTLLVFMINGIVKFNVDFLLIGSFAMLIFCILYLLEQYNDPQGSSLLQNPMFWVTVGLFLFNAGEFSYNLLSKYFIENKMDPSLKLFRAINNKLILILYSSFIIAFICQKITGTYKKD
jgi:hypothetical protein